MTVAIDIDALSRDECMTLLTTAPIGRVVHTDRALPTVTPVNFTVDNDDILIHVGRRSPLGRLAGGAVLAFEVDEYDSRTGMGWSVVVTGRINGSDEPEAGSGNDRLLRLQAEMVTGRRLRP